MDKDRIKGAAQKIKGSIKSTVGKITGNKRLQAEGNVDKAIGTVQTVAGNTKDTIRAAVKNRTK